MKNPSLSKKRTAFFVYILECRDRSYYTGYTRDLEKRLELHRKRRGSKYVAARLPCSLVYREGHSSQRRAMRREMEIKRWTRKKKLALISG